MLSYHHFGGQLTLPVDYLSRHLAYEWQENQDPYGMRVLSNPVQEDSIWMNGKASVEHMRPLGIWHCNTCACSRHRFITIGPPTWTYLQLALRNVSTEAAFEPFKRMSENFRLRLRDQWNLRALTHTQTAGTELEHG